MTAGLMLSDRSRHTNQSRPGSAPTVATYAALIQEPAGCTAECAPGVTLQDREELQRDAT